MGDWWRGVGDLPDLSAVVPGFERRRHRRPPRHHRAAALRRRPRGRRGLAVADLHLADGRHGLRRLGLYRHRPDLRHRSPTSTRWSRGRTRSGSRSSSTRCCRIRRDRASLLPREPAEPRQPQGRLVRLGRSEARRLAAEQLALGLRRRRLGVGRAAAAVLPAQLPRRAAGLQLPQSGGAGLAARRRCASGWSAASTASASTPSTSTSTTSCCATTRPTSAARTSRSANPYGMQYHLFSKNQPENLAFLERMRTLLDEYEARAHGRRDGREPSRDPDDGRVHHRQAAAQVLLVRDARRPLRRRRTSAARSRSSTPARRAAGRAGPSRTTTCARHVTRWAKHGIGREPLAKLAGGAAPVARGLDLHLPGRGARPDRDRARALRADRPAGHPLLAGADRPRRLPHADGLGRRRRPNAGFSTGRPWLPVKAPQAAQRTSAGQPGRRRSRCSSSTARC